MTINWSHQVKGLNLFALPFLFPSYSALDAVEAGDPGKRLFKLVEQKGVIPIAWGENGYRELTNSKRPIHYGPDRSQFRPPTCRRQDGSCRGTPRLPRARGWSPPFDTCSQGY